MGFNIIKNGSHAQYGTVEFIADTVADIESAPTDLIAGSKIFCIENSTTYILTPSSSWVEYPVGGGGGGSAPKHGEKLPIGIWLEQYGDNAFGYPAEGTSRFALINDTTYTWGTVARGHAKLSMQHTFWRDGDRQSIRWGDAVQNMHNYDGTRYNYYTTATGGRTNSTTVYDVWNNLTTNDKANDSFIAYNLADTSHPVLLKYLNNKGRVKYEDFMKNIKFSDICKIKYNLINPKNIKGAILQKSSTATDKVPYNLILVMDEDEFYTVNANGKINFGVPRMGAFNTAVTNELITVNIGQATAPMNEIDPSTIVRNTYDIKNEAGEVIVPKNCDLEYFGIEGDIEPTTITFSTVYNHTIAGLTGLTECEQELAPGNWIIAIMKSVGTYNEYTDLSQLYTLTYSHNNFTSLLDFPVPLPKTAEGATSFGECHVISTNSPLTLHLTNDSASSNGCHQGTHLVCVKLEGNINSVKKLDTLNFYQGTSSLTHNYKNDTIMVHTFGTYFTPVSRSHSNPKAVLKDYFVENHKSLTDTIPNGYTEVANYLGGETSNYYSGTGRSGDIQFHIELAFNEEE